MIKVRKNLRIVNNEYLESNIINNKEGILFYIKYKKGDEDYIFLNIKCVIKEEEYYLCETINNKISLWRRELLKDKDVVYPVRLPMRCDRIKIFFESNKNIFENNSDIEIEIDYNFWD